VILAIDTSTASCSAALFDSGGQCIAHRDEVIGRGHSERLVPMLDELLDGRRADGIIVGVGPGSFTGIRVGIAAAQGLAIAWNCELSGMSSLALLAAGASEDGDAAAAGRFLPLAPRATRMWRPRSTGVMANCSSSSLTQGSSR